MKNEKQTIEEILTLNEYIENEDDYRQKIEKELGTLVNIKVVKNTIEENIKSLIEKLDTIKRFKIGIEGPISTEFENKKTREYMMLLYVIDDEYGEIEEPFICDVSIYIDFDKVNIKDDTKGIITEIGLDFNC